MILFCRICIFLITLLVFGMKHGEVRTFRMALECYCKFDSIYIDPVILSDSFSYNNYVNFYGRLLYYNEKEKIVPMLTNSYQWINDKLEFQFDSRLRTNKGFPVTASDAEKSIYRAIDLYDQSSYLNMKKYLCPNYNAHSMNSRCEGIINIDNKLILKPVRPEYRDIIVELLIHPMYSILPKSAIADKKDKYKIIDAQHTTGAYYLFKDSEAGDWELHQNIYFPFSLPRSPLIVKYIKTDLDYTEAFTKGMTDIIPEYNMVIDRKEMNIIKSMGAHIIKGLHSSNFILFFNQSAFDKMNLQERITLGNQFRDQFLSGHNYVGQKAENTLFNSLNMASLNLQQSQTVSNLYDSHKVMVPTKNITYAVPEAFAQKRQKMFAQNQFVKFKIFPRDEVNTNVYFRGGDIFTKLVFSSMLDSFVNIVSFAESEYFDLRLVDLNKTVNAYIEASSNSERASIIQKKHFELLMNAHVFPLMKVPQIVVTTKNWKFNSSALKIDMELWMLEYVND